MTGKFGSKAAKIEFEFGTAVFHSSHCLHLIANSGKLTSYVSWNLTRTNCFRVSDVLNSCHAKLKYFYFRVVFT